MWPGPRPTCTPSFILIHPTVWSQYTNVTDRTDRQTENGLIACGEPFYKRSPKIVTFVPYNDAMILIVSRQHTPLYAANGGHVFKSVVAGRSIQRRQNAAVGRRRAGREEQSVPNETDSECHRTIPAHSDRTTLNKPTRLE